MRKNELRIVFMGTPEFAVQSLSDLVENGFNIVAVVTAPDKKAGRGQSIQTSAVKIYAEELGVPILQPTDLKDPTFINQLNTYKPNLQVVVAFRKLPEEVFTLPEFGTFNLHASLLPQYRGAAPIHWAVINGETKTGVTTFFIDKTIDTGSIIEQKSTDIKEDDTTGMLYARLMKLGADTVVSTCKAIADGKAKATPQATDEKNLKKAPKIYKKDCEINWNQDTDTVYNFIRGMSPIPCAWTMIGDQVLKIYFGKKVHEKHNQTPGEMYTDNKTILRFATTDGWIECTQIQLQDKKSMSVEDFLRGNQL